MSDLTFMDILLFLRGMLIGFSIAAPVGPIGVLCIRRTIAEGRLAGFLSGAGAATADALYGSVAAFGLAAVSSILLQQQDLLRLVGGAFLLYLGLRTFISKPASMAAKVHRDSKNYFGAYLSTFLLTLTNPLTILSFMAIFASLGSSGSNYVEAAVIVAGVFSGSLTWWFLLSLLAGVFQAQLAGERLVWVNRLSGLVIVIFAGVILAGFFIPVDKQPASSVKQPVSAPPPGQSQMVEEGFVRADGVKPFSFPQDFGPHPEYQTEWWYYTGNLTDQEGRRFGYQLTFFRRSIQPVIDRVDRNSAWATDQVYLAHLALTDVKGDQHYSFERLSRGAINLAGAAADPFQVWLEDWQVKSSGDREFRLAANVPAGDNPEIVLDFNLTDTKGVILQGDQGYSRKGADPGNASYYYSLTRMKTTGTLNLDGQIFEVSGTSWMDHEYSTSALAENQVGWDWFSIQLDNNQELMLFQLRQSDGSVAGFSNAAVIASDGKVTRFDPGDFEIKVTRTWLSPTSGGLYPAAWEITIPKAGISLTLLPVIADQEMDLQYRYWEGAVDVRGLMDGRSVSGVGYVELTGYAQSLASEF